MNSQLLPHEARRPIRLGIALGVVLLLVSATLVAQNDELDRSPDTTSTTESDRTVKSVFSTTTAVISWPSLDEAGSSMRSILPEELLAQIDAAPLPVLLPADLSSSSPLRISSSSNSLAVSVRTAERPFVLYGSRVFHAIPDLPVESSSETQLVSRDREHRATISGDEGVWTAAWNEFGVAYMLRMGCSDSDVDCEDRIRERVAALVFVGGDR